MDHWQNQLYFGDNLGILQSGAIPLGSVDLVYLDPPFNSNATYNLLFAEKTGEKSHAQITAFEDTWHWGDEAAAAYDDVLRHGPPKLAALLQALRAFLGQNDHDGLPGHDGGAPGGVAPSLEAYGEFVSAL
jgi:site-specific DNA-methyltransferase (adenine-specific)